MPGSPGKFEAAPPFAESLWGQGLEGFADTIEDEHGDPAFGFKITAEDVARDPRLAEYLGTTLMLIEDEQGFVTAFAVEPEPVPPVAAQLLGGALVALAVVLAANGVSWIIEWSGVA